MRIVIAPDKFKGSLDAAGVAAALAAGIGSAAPSATLIELPVADGGEGSLACALAAGWKERERIVTGPVGTPVRARYAVAPDGRAALVELAEASGMQRLPDGPHGPAFDATGATSRGTGELIRAALDEGCARIVLAVGGSACTDGGAGLVSALGARLYDDRDTPLPDGGAALARLARLDLSALDPRATETEFVLASDVDNPLTGPRGAATVFAPQKGASEAEVGQLDTALERWAAAAGEALPSVQGLAAAPGAGAAGGVGFAALTFLRAAMRPGADVMLDLVGFDAAVAGADLVVTGEGSLDAQSLGGKAPVRVAARARSLGVSAFAVCGRTLLSDSQIRDAGFAAAHTLTDLEPDTERAIAAPIPLLERVGAAIGRALSEPHSSNSSSSL